MIGAKEPGDLRSSVPTGRALSVHRQESGAMDKDAIDA
jgi:hypothetical protein